MPDYFSLNTGMMFEAKLAASDPVFPVLAGVKEICADPRVITIIMSIFSPLQRGGTRERAGKIVSLTAMIMLGAATFGGCSSFSVLVQ